MASAYLSKLSEEFSLYEEIIMKKCQNHFLQTKKISKKLVLEKAFVNEKNDIYHSTTIEGYHITPEDVDALLIGKTINNSRPGHVKNKMAILGHKFASEFMIAQIEKDFGKPRITHDLISDAYFHLFRPSVDAHILKKMDLMGYRTCSVFLRGSRYVPPSPEKIPDLMELFVQSINDVKHPIAKAILSHYFFVTIHPYPDGNGRTARLLMNYILSCSGIPWMTITADKREIYFEALQQGQLDNNILPFAKFVCELL